MLYLLASLAPVTKTLVLCGQENGLHAHAQGGAVRSGDVAGLDDLPAISVTMLDGMANPIPGAAPPSCWSVAASVGMPTTWPARSARAPPLLPGLMAAEAPGPSAAALAGHATDTTEMTGRAGEQARGNG